MTRTSDEGSATWYLGRMPKEGTMPVGRTEDDGRPFRQYRGKPQPLGTLTEWSCPSCGQKVSGQVYEEGCPHCGVGVPSAQPVARQPQQEQLSEALQKDQAIPREARPSSKASAPPGVALVVTRVIQYICKPGGQAAMEQTLQRALVGRVGFAWGEIVAAIVDDVSPRQQDILGLAKRQPGVWLGGPNTVPQSVQIGDWRVTALSPQMPLIGIQEAPGREEAHPGQPFVGRAMELPDTGPEFSRLDAEMAKVLVQACGVRVAYTLAMSLQALAVANDDGDTLILSQRECYALANAIMQLIPRDYVEPELPPPPPPNAGPVDQDVAARIAAIQAASKPTASFRE